jgi:hypothetical protein
MNYKQLIKNIFLKENNENTYETFEFISAKEILNKKSKNNFLNSKNSWIDMFNDSIVKIKVAKPLFSNKYTKNYYTEKNNGLSIRDLSKENKISGSIIANLGKCKIINNTLLVMVKKNIALVESYGDKRWADFQINKWPAHHNFYKCKIFISNFFYNKRINLYKVSKNTKFIRKPAIYLSTREDDQVYHWMFENLPRLYCLDLFPKLRSYPLLVRNKLSYFQKETLRLMGVKNKIIVTGDCDVELSHLYFPSIPSPPILNKKLLIWLRRKLLLGAIRSSASKANKTIFSKKIFISRNDSNHRKIINESQLFEKLKNKGFVSYQLSKMTLSEQILLFNNAQIVIMPHGAGGVHTLYMSKKAKLVEIHSPEQTNNIFYCLSKILKLNYSFILGINPIKNHMKNYYVDIEKFMQSLNRVF